MVEGEEWKTAFYTQYSLFESLVMAFSLTNMPAIFQNIINNILVPYLNQVCTTYLDNTLIDSDTFEEHHEHVNLVLEAFEKASLHHELANYEFYY
jgi:hypothetical protein